MPLKCRCVCTCKLLVSEKSAGKTIKCPKCARRLRVPQDAVQRRERQMATRQVAPASERSKLRLPLSSLVDLPEPDPPPVVERLDLREDSAAEAESLSATMVDQILAVESTEPAAAKPELLTTATGPKPPPRPQTKSWDQDSATASAPVPELIEPSAKPAVDESVPPLDTSAASAVPVSMQTGLAETVTEKVKVSAEQPPLLNKSSADSVPAGKAIPPPRVTQPLASTTLEPVAPPPIRNATPELPPKKQGYLLDRDRRDTVRWLACSVLGLAIVGIIPAVWDIVEYFRSVSSLGLSRWAYALLMIGVVQAAYAIYLVQLPDWSSVWVVTVVTLVIAAGYAMMLGLTLLASQESHFIQLLDLADRLHGGQATLWCLIMLSLTSLLSYLSSRVASRWQKAFVA